jgi:hypothetical protein
MLRTFRQREQIIRLLAVGFGLEVLVSIAASRNDQPNRISVRRFYPELPFAVRPAWALLEKHYQKLKAVHLRQLFADDRERGESLAIQAAGLYLDYSKNRITDETLRLLLVRSL